MSLTLNINQIVTEAKLNGFENSTFEKILNNSLHDSYIGSDGHAEILGYFLQKKEFFSSKYTLTTTGYFANQEDTIWVESANCTFHTTEDSEYFRHDEITDDFILVEDSALVRDNYMNYYTHIDNCTSWNDIYYFESIDRYVTQRWMDRNDVVQMPCGTLEYSCDVHYWESDGEYHYEEEEGQIRSYSYKPYPNFHKTKGETTPLYMGIELEVENELSQITCNKMSKKVHDILDEVVYMKTDGSLMNGFEIVSHPMSFSYISENTEKFKKTLETLSSNGFRSYSSNTCGMHIHMSKESFTTWQLFRFMEFFQKKQKLYSSNIAKGIEQIRQMGGLNR